MNLQVRACVWFVCVSLLLPALPGEQTLAQSGVTVELEEVVDDRFSEGPLRGSLQIRASISGKDLDKALASRVVVREARDDQGTDLITDRDVPDFQPSDYNSGKLDIRLNNPSRKAKSFSMKGAVELYVPSRDANSRVKIEKALSRLDTPFNAKALRAAKISITPLSREKYNERMKGQEIDDEKIEELRAAGKAEGASEEEIEEAIGFIRALAELGGGEVEEGSVILSASSDTFDRIHRIEILGADGKPMSLTSRSLSSWGDDAVMILDPSETPPASPTLEILVLTDKSRISVPFDLKNVALP